MPVSSDADRGSDEPSNVSLVESEAFDDIHDTDSENGHYGELLPLKYCSPIADAFECADKKAKKFQGWHRFVTRIAAFAATAAVAAAIFTLVYLAALPRENTAEPKSQPAAAKQVPRSRRSLGNFCSNRGRCLPPVLPLSPLDSGVYFGFTTIG